MCRSAPATFLLLLASLTWRPAVAHATEPAASVVGSVRCSGAFFESETRCSSASGLMVVQLAGPTLSLVLGASSHPGAESPVRYAATLYNSVAAAAVVLGIAYREPLPAVGLGVVLTVSPFARRTATGLELTVVFP